MYETAEPTRQLVRLRGRSYVAFVFSPVVPVIEWLADIDATRAAGFTDVRVRGEELLANWFGWFNRALEASADPADVPMTRSAPVTSSPASNRPAMTPISQALPAAPPPPRTSARSVEEGVASMGVALS